MDDAGFAESKTSCNLGIPRISCRGSILRFEPISIRVLEDHHDEVHGTREPKQDARDRPATLCPVGAPDLDSLQELGEAAVGNLSSDMEFKRQSCPPYRVGYCSPP